MFVSRHSLAVCLPIVALSCWAFLHGEEPAPAAASPVSYYKQVRPLLQSNCQGCHQPSKSGGDYVMTDFARLVAGGESEEAAIVPGQPDQSALLRMITPDNGEAEMPKGKQPLAAAEIDLIRQWIAQGALDDTPANAVQRYDADHPPLYSRQPVVTAIDFSPDGRLLAISGFHEVLLHRADGSGLVARLIGLSERIESVRFSPDGKRLAVTGGLPCRMGELQVWHVEQPEQPALTLSVPVTYDTIYGASWSPDGTLVAVGCADKTVRAFNSESGDQVFFSGAHEDWALDTVFSADGSHLVSVGRDMSTKLYDVATQRFIDNVTSITPGALKGGLSAVARHPERDEVLIGGSDGTPRIYRMQRTTKRVIGDDANLIRRFPALTGRIFSVDYSPDGKRIVAASSLDGKGQVFTYAAEFDSTMPDDIEKIVQKVVTTQSAEEKTRLAEYVTSDVRLLTQTAIPSAVYSVAFAPDGKTIAVAGADGAIRLLNENGEIASEFAPVAIDGDASRSTATLAAAADSPDFFGPEQLPPGAVVASLEVEPPQVALARRYGTVQLLVTGVLRSGDRIDLTRLAQIAVEGNAVTVTNGGRVRAAADGDARLRITFGDQTAHVPVRVSGFGDPPPVDFVRDVNPVVSRLGCNQGTCHGAKDGKNGFKLSLRGYDPIMDARSFTDDMSARRVNLASPDDSLMLLKATGAVPHVGGQIIRPGHSYYEIIRQWIADGAVLDVATPRVVKLEITPQDPVILDIGSKQQMRLVATYADGLVRDVTGEAFIDSGNTEVAEINRHGVVTTIRRGEAPLLARFEGNYAAATITSMGDREGFVWQPPESWGEIDNLVSAKWERMKILPSGLCRDEEFVRRVFLDLTGLPPTADEVRAFTADPRDSRAKRDELIDRLIGSDPFIVYWTNKWADLLQVNSKFLGTAGATSFRDWIRAEVAGNTPYDEFCYKVLTASGSNKDHPAAAYYKILRDPEPIMENTTHLFLGVRFNCNKCHDHPFERWTQDQYYQTAAFFARVGLERDPNNAAGDIGGTAVEGAKPQWEVVSDKETGEVVHLRTAQVAPPEVPYDAEIPTPDEATRREHLARWITSPENDYFARSYANRVWGYLMGVGLIEPLDDIRAGNPPTNPELLEHLTRQFIDSDFNVRELMRSICKSRVYQLSIATQQWNQDDTRNYSHAVPKRLPAETLYDAIYTVTGSKMQIPGVPEGTRAAAIPDAGTELADRFLANLGRPVRESACECERSSGLQLGPVMALMNGPTVSEAISQPDNAIAQLVAAQPDNAALVNEIFMRVLNRPAEPAEIDATLDSMHRLQAEHAALVASLAARHEELRPLIAAAEQKRAEAIAAAQQAHDAHQEAIRPAREMAEQERLARLAAAEAALAGYDAELPPRIAAWEASVSGTSTGWIALDPVTLEASTKATLERQDDLSIFVSGKNDRRGEFAVTCEINRPGLTGIKLEALSDPRLPGSGPGRAANGNFVLSEFSAFAWPKGQPDAKAPLALHNARADFSQDHYDVATAIDGENPTVDNGWAIGNEFGKDHVATFELTEPLAAEGPTMLHFVLDQQFTDKDHTLGKFRISVTTAKPPLQFGLPENIQQLVQTAAAARTPEQTQALVDYFKSIDDDLKQKQSTLRQEQQPLPEDPQLTALRRQIADVSQPLPVDPQLLRLQRAVELGSAQLQNERLTTAQDLTWALINGPAFLFNR